MKIWIESHVPRRMGAGLTPWMSGMVSCMQIETRHTDTPFPPLMCRKMWMRKWELKMKRHPPHPFFLHVSLSFRTGAWLSCDSVIRPPTQHTRAPHTNTHTYTRHMRTDLLPSHTWTSPALPPVTYIACVDTYTVTHTLRSRGGGNPHQQNNHSYPPTPTPLLQTSQWAASVSGKNYPYWHLETKTGTWEWTCFCIADRLIEQFCSKCLSADLWRCLWGRVRPDLWENKLWLKT